MSVPFLPKSTFRKALAIAASVLAVTLLVSIILLHFYWPFTESAVRRELGDAASADVSFRSFHNEYFPPGCVADGVVIKKSGASLPLITVERLVIRSNIFGLLRHHVSLMRAEGAKVNWQRMDSSSDTHSQPTVIDQFVADDATLEIPRNSPDGLLRFVFHKFKVGNLRGQGQSSFAAEFDNPLPHGRLSISGHFGPWNGSRPTKTALDGNYSLEHADLGVFHSIAGFVTSTGRFGGTFDHIEVQGQTSTPELQVTSTHHGLPLQTDFSALVVGPSGEVFLRTVKAQFGRDELDAHGSIAKGADGKRIANLDIQCNNGRIEDTLYPFIHSPKSALIGKVKFRMHVMIPPEKEKFVKKITLQSTFQIEDAQFTHAETQLRLSKISETPNQQNPNTSLPAQFQGQVLLKDGIARFSELKVQDQGAAATFHGSFDLTDQRVSMRGSLKTEASLTKTTHGIKSVFAKVVEPFFKKKPHVTIVPVKIGGTYSHPQFGLDLSQKM